jgi:hypothetical protein
LNSYKRRIANGETILPIIVLKNPGKEIYAVLDGHHRYCACLDLGMKEMTCAYAGNFSGLVFTMARYGFFQATEVTEYILVAHVGVRYYAGKGMKDLQLFFQKLRTLSIRIFFTPVIWAKREPFEDLDKEKRSARLTE